MVQTIKDIYENMLYEGPESTLREAVEAAVAAGIWLTEADLEGADLAGVDLHWVDLRRSYLRATDLTGANLSGADLTWAHLANTNLTNAILTGAHINERWREHIQRFPTIGEPHYLTDAQPTKGAD